MAKFLKRRPSSEPTEKMASGVPLEETDKAFAKAYPALAEFLSLESWDEKTTRERGTVTVFWEEGSFKASVNDRDGGRVAFVTKTVFTELLAHVDKGLSGDTLDWRLSKAVPRWKKKH